MDLVSTPVHLTRKGIGLVLQSGATIWKRASALLRDDHQPAPPSTTPARPAQQTAAERRTPKTSAASPPPVPAPPTVPEPAAAQPAPEVRAPAPEPDTLVASFADPGAEDGAGATLRVDEPWPGYGQMKAGEVTDRLAVADASTLGAVQLYETTHRKRRTVIAEAERRMQQVARQA